MLKYLCLAVLLVVPQLAEAQGGCRSYEAGHSYRGHYRNVREHRGFRAGGGCNGFQASAYAAGGCTGFQASSYQSSGCNGRQGGGYYQSATVTGTVPAPMPRASSGKKSHYSAVPAELAKQLLDDHATANPGKFRGDGSKLMAILTEIITYLQAHNVSLSSIIAEVQRIIALIHGTPVPPTPAGP